MFCCMSSMKKENEKIPKDSTSSNKPKILTVFGATGNQGGSVISAVLADPILSKEFTIRAVTRDVNKPAAKALADLGVEVVCADMSTPELAAPAVKDAHTIFLMTNFWETMSPDVEITHGKAVTDAAKAAGVKHIIFSSLIDVAAATQGRLTHVVHFDGKAEIERYIRASGVPATFFLPGMFMNTLFDFMTRDAGGLPVLAWPVDGNTAKVPLIDIVGDTGKYVKAAIKQFPSSVGKQLLGCPEYLSPQRIISEFSQATGKPAKFVQVTDEEWKAAWPHAASAQELLETVKLLDDVGYYIGQDLSESLAMLEEKPTSWMEFVEQNKQRWL